MMRGIGWKIDMSILIDVPQVAYKSWMLEFRIYDEDDNRMLLKEREAEHDLKMSLIDWKYSADHEHVR